MLVGAAADIARRLEPGPADSSGRSRDTGRTTRRPDPDLDPEELRYAPREPRRLPWLSAARRGRRRPGRLLVLGGRCAYDWSQRQYYVGG